jgi:LPXTG-site transpeptidase (sortase) family protein
VLLLVGGYLQLSSNPSAPSTPTARPSTTTAVPTEPASKATSPRSKKTAKPSKTTSSAPANPANPIRVSVPSLGVSARVVGIRASDGALIPPSNPRLVGWWSDGAQPGAAKGSAVITGHTVHNGGGAFDNLDQLAAGGAVRITTERGTIDYVVSSVTIYRKKALAKQAAQVFDQRVPGRLVLVTCEDWDGTAYLSNAVVIATPVN